MSNPKAVIKNRNSTKEEILSAIEECPKLVWKLRSSQITNEFLAHAITHDFSIVGSLRFSQITPELVDLIKIKECKINDSFVVDTTIYVFLKKYCEFKDNIDDAVEHLWEYDYHEILLFLYASDSDSEEDEEDEEDEEEELTLN